MLEALQIDTLKLVQRLVARGIDQQQAEVMVSEIFSTKIYNISSEKEVTNMVAEAIRAVLDESKSQFKEIESRFEKSRAESDARFEKSRAESDARFERIRQDIRQDMKQERRWIVGTIFSVAAALATLAITLHNLH